MDPRDEKIAGGKLTYADYAAIPDDGKRYQVLDGELVVTPAPTTIHQKVSARLGLILANHVEELDLGLLLFAPVDVLLSRHDIVQPDIVFVEKARLGIVEDKYIHGSPDLVVEILSPGTRRTDRKAKSEIYARNHVPWYWIVDPDAKRVEEWKRGSRSYALEQRIESGMFEPRAFAGLCVDTTRVFRP